MPGKCLKALNVNLKVLLSSSKWTEGLFKRSQHRATLLGQQCCTMLDEGFKQVQTQANIIQHSVQTRPTCCIQQCWVMLVQHVGFV